jgi:predicted component of type VI protein secretion system
MVYASEGTFYVRNLSQTNTVRINDDNRLGYEESASLGPGDILRLGPVEIHVKANNVIEELQNRTLKIRCSNCGQVTDYKPESFCPWCGMSLAGSQTVIG